MNLHCVVLNGWGPVGGGAIKYGLSLASVSAIFVFTLAKPLEGKLFSGDDPAAYRRQEIDGLPIVCDYYRRRRNFDPEVDLPQCAYLPLNSSWSGRSIYYLGNSHAGHLSGLISELRFTTDFRHIVFFAGGVPNPPIAIDYYPSKQWGWRSEDAAT